MLAGALRELIGHGVAQMFQGGRLKLHDAFGPLQRLVEWGDIRWLRVL
jgi:hypothetical protein